MSLDGRNADSKMLGDLRVSQSMANQLDDLQLAIREGEWNRLVRCPGSVVGRQIKLDVGLHRLAPLPLCPRLRLANPKKAQAGNRATFDAKDHLGCIPGAKRG